MANPTIAEQFAQLIAKPGADHPGVPGLPPGAEQIDSQLVADLAHHLALSHQLLQQTFGELAAIFQAPTPVWSRPSDTVQMHTEFVPTDKPHGIYGGLDKARVTILNVSVSPDGGTTPAANLHISARESYVANGSSSMVLPAGAAFTIDTRAPLFVLADAASAAVSTCIEAWQNL